MRAFMDENFLLTTDAAKALYHDFAEHMPIYDYHCHLNPRDIWENKPFDNVGALMLSDDHYKWRAMRSNGVDDVRIYPGADDRERFFAYAGTLKYAIGNPLYHWTHLELRRAFGIDDILTESSAQSVWDRANALLREEGFRPRALIEKFGVAALCTCDDPADSLSYHAALREEGKLKAYVLPTFRPDRALDVEKPDFSAYMAQLGDAAGIAIRSADDLLAALEARLDFFVTSGTRLSDHGLNVVAFQAADDADADGILRRAMDGRAPSDAEAVGYRSWLMTKLGRMYAKRGIAMQLHMNALRSNNTRMLQKVGPNTGFDSARDTSLAEPLSRLLDAIESAGGLPKTILFSLNPADNCAIGTMLGNFQGEVPGKIQMGSAWWVQDHKDGMIEQMKSLASLGLLGRFVGMLTDSRSFLSYPRHEYFRRILCELIGGWVENGEYPDDRKTLGELVRGICYENALAYFCLPDR